jgi:hypothetical protein
MPLVLLGTQACAEVQYAVGMHWLSSLQLVGHVPAAQR